MGWVSGTVTYILVWWVLLFCLLPLGNNKTYNEQAGVGHAASAPINPRLGKKLLLNSALSFIVLGLIELALKWLPLDEWVSLWAY